MLNTIITSERQACFARKQHEGLSELQSKAPADKSGYFEAVKLCMFFDRHCNVLLPRGKPIKLSPTKL